MSRSVSYFVALYSGDVCVSLELQHYKRWVKYSTLEYKKQGSGAG